MKFSKSLISLCVLGGLAFSANAAVTAFQVNGTTVSKADQEEVIDALVKRGATRDAQLEQRVRYMLIRDTALLQQAKNAKLDRRKDVKDNIRKSTDALLIRTLVSDWIKANPIKDSEVRDLYEKEKKAWGNEEVSVRHILVRDEAKAKEVLKKLRSGEKFEALAKEYSIDTEQNKNAGGLIDWTSPVVFDSDFAASFKNLKPGKMTTEPVKTRLGWHIVKLEGRRAAQRWSNFDTVKASLTQLITQQKVQTYIDSIVNKAKVTDAK